ncbi:cobalt-precorrin 5A hydrolase/precorrin-3B C17-methyltransferase [Paraburkholderia bannensis]|uniref:Cobalt-precorrin 5A hydrolase/precorrin-3B C17-methyltransferase n=1 Tax=Paraburkholderia bannensis TaxID=765414 RepID=A0A7W9U201_9BURK|nr:MULTISPECIES: precorrin-3B C(17)-methyltransferase [Paraburkholderia]MBB3260522.1 cobalt-precorrin 5A hydrolase/precorrin-3B C17-methyltransferase [Paraburkholderia sp. WP4_3_2]MBB6105558.1 cobalt-precorrin 5A hydrolase/precorrin-3B C17-methyltransferase [Paraburkholderia bannensis]
MATLSPALHAPAVVILGPGALATAQRVKALYAGAQIHALQDRAQGDIAFTELGEHLRELYRRGTPLIALCAAGIVIRCLAPLLANKGIEPPVLALAEDGSAVVPLLGGLTGVNVMARAIGAALGIAPAITTSGELRFGTCLLNPPEGYALSSLTQGKRFVSDLLAGDTTRIDGDAPWLDNVDLPRNAAARHAIRVSPQAWDGNPEHLVIHPRSVVARATESPALLAEYVREALAGNGLAEQALAALVAPVEHMGDAAFEQAAAALGVPLRFVDGESLDALKLPEPHRLIEAGHGITLGVADEPLDVSTLGRARGRLTVLGLGPGCADLLTPMARAALDEATDIVGYATYVEMAGPLRPGQVRHATDNREELQRARHAFELACEGRRVVVVSSGDPGVFAMAAAVLEALEGAEDLRWRRVDLRIVPGVSAALATAAQAGAPLGHDFCMLSLSDNLKPWAVIEKRLHHAALADLVMAFYNPISRARPWQLDRALEIVRAVRAPQTRVVLGRDVGRPGETLRAMTLGELQSSDVDMRTMVIVGSSATRGFGREGARDGSMDEWVYTPRWYK